MSPTAVVREGLELYKAHWRTFIPLALVVYVILGVVSFLLVWLLSWLGAIIAALIGIVGAFWLQGAITEAVRDVRDGKQDLSLGQTFARIRPKLPAVIAAGLIAGIAIFVGLLLLIVPGLFLLTIWSLIIPTIVLEGRSAGDSFGRSREIVRGNGWNVFGVIVITFLTMLVASIVVGLLTFWLPDGLDAFVSDVITGTVIAPFVAVSWTLMYFALVRPAAADAPVATQPPAPA